MVRMRLAKGANDDATGGGNGPIDLIAESKWRTLLQCAGQKGHIKAVYAIVAGKANVDAANKHQATRLHYAALTGYIEVICRC